MSSAAQVPAVTRKARWEHFPHAADVGVRGFGATPAEAFEQGALALTAIVTHAAVEPREAVQVKCQAPDLEILFAEWLNLRSRPCRWQWWPRPNMLGSPAASRACGH